MKPKYDCRFIASYYYDILENVDFLDILQTAVGSEFKNNPSALEDFKFEYDCRMTGVDIQKFMFELLSSKFPINKLCEKCQHKFQCRLAKNNIFKPHLTNAIPSIS